MSYLSSNNINIMLQYNIMFIMLINNMCVIFANAIDELFFQRLSDKSECAGDNVSVATGYMGI